MKASKEVKKGKIIQKNGSIYLVIDEKDVEEFGLKLGDSMEISMKGKKLTLRRVENED